MTRTDGPNPVLYTRNGFAGRTATLLRSQYSADYTRVKGSYAPRIYNLNDLDEAAFNDRRAMPVSIMNDGTVSLEIAYRREAAPFATRNVLADEVHVVLAGSATLETEFGVLSVAKDDIVLIPRAISYRFVDIVGELREFLIVTENELNFAMSPGLGPLTRMDAAAPSPTRPRGQVSTRHSSVTVTSSPRCSRTTTRSPRSASTATGSWPRSTSTTSGRSIWAAVCWSRH